MLLPFLDCLAQLPAMIVHFSGRPPDRCSIYRCIVQVPNEQSMVVATREKCHVYRAIRRLRQRKQERCRRLHEPAAQTYDARVKRSDDAHFLRPSMLCGENLLHREETTAPSVRPFVSPRSARPFSTKSSPPDQPFLISSPPFLPSLLNQPSSCHPAFTRGLL